MMSRESPRRSVDSIIRKLFGPGVNSTDRLAAMLALTEGADASVFWTVFHRAWSNCDDTWDQRAALYSALVRHAPAVPHLKGNDLEFWNALPEVVTVYRGGDWLRRRGMSWTTDKEVAEGFARGHRNIRPVWPVVLEARIKKRSVLTVFTDRSESEVLVRPRALQRMTWEKRF